MGNMRNVNDPYECRTHNTLVDKLIGNAFDVVRYVAMNMKEILYVAVNMENIYIVATNVRDNTVVVGIMPDTIAPVLLPYPTGVVYENLLNYQAIVFGPDGIVLPDPARYRVTLGSTGITLHTIDHTLIGSDYRITLTHGELNEPQA